MMSVLGLKDDYQHDGRVLAEDLTAPRSRLPRNRVSSSRWREPTSSSMHLSATSGWGRFKLATAAMSSGYATKTRIHRADAALTQLGTQRDGLTSQMLALLEGAEFGGTAIDTVGSVALISRLDLLGTLPMLPVATSSRWTSRAMCPGRARFSSAQGQDAAGWWRLRRRMRGQARPSTTSR